MPLQTCNYKVIFLLFSNTTAYIQTLIVNIAFAVYQTNCIEYTANDPNLKFFQINMFNQVSVISTPKTGPYIYHRSHE